MKLFAQMLRYVIIIIALPFGAMVCAFNMEPIIFTLPFGGAMQIPMAMIMIVSFVAGILTMFGQFSVELVSRSFKQRKLNKEISHLRSERDDPEIDS